MSLSLSPPAIPDNQPALPNFARCMGVSNGWKITGRGLAVAGHHLRRVDEWVLRPLVRENIHIHSPIDG